jgi:hypothetical protein
MLANPPLLELGLCDRGAVPADLVAYFQTLHEGELANRTQFRGEKDAQWIAPGELDGTNVRDLQVTLRDTGFYPQGELDGVFGYRTLAGVRVFQEYVRSVERFADVGVPDGIVGPRTWAHLQRWRSAGQQADWVGSSTTTPQLECRYWTQVLSAYRDLNEKHPVNPVVPMVNAFPFPTDTLKTSEWRADPADIHIIGIRRQERRTRIRQDDDLFVLLVSGMVFKFYGSTDPNAEEVRRPDEPYIVRGQHRYRFGWHKVSERDRTYRAFRPTGPGVLVFRDLVQDPEPTDDDLVGGLSANPTINIHWGGFGTLNWSAGCQVIAGDRYVNHHNDTVSCASFAARDYAELPRNTRGAFNVLLDLATIFAPSVAVVHGTSIYYTLVYEEDLNLEVSPGQSLGAAALAALGPIEEAELAAVRSAVSVDGLVATLVGNA